MANPRLQDIVKNAASGDWDIPEFQREFEWKPEQVSILFNSLYRGLPIGLFTLWNTTQYNEPQKKPASGRKPLWIIDGQQRVVSFCILAGTKPNWIDNEDWYKIFGSHRVYLNIDKVGKAIIGRLSRKASVSIALDELIHMEPGDVIKVINEKCSASGIQGNEASNQAVKALKILERVIPVEEVGDDKGIEDIAELYIRLNKQGTRLTQAQVTLAWVSQYNLGWVRETFYPFLQEMEDNAGWKLDPTNVIQVMAILSEGKARVGKASPELWKSGIKPIWPQVRGGIDDCILYLWERGIIEAEMVPSSYALVSLFSMAAKFSKLPEYDRESLHRWFILANLAGRYGDSPLETLASDADIIFSASTMGEALAKLDIDFTKKDLETFVGDKFKDNSSQALLLHSLLWSDEIKDWCEPYGLPALTKAPRNLEPHWHHILPKSFGRRFGYENYEYTANLTRLCGKTNVNKLSFKPPWEYVPENKITKEALMEHLVPERFAEKFVKGQIVNPKEFKDFLNEREKLIVDKAANLLKL